MPHHPIIDHIGVDGAALPDLPDFKPAFFVEQAEGVLNPPARCASDLSESA